MGWVYPLPSFPSHWPTCLRGPKHCLVPQYHQRQPQTGTIRMSLGTRLQPRVPALSSEGFSTCAGTLSSGTGSSLAFAGASVGVVFFIDLDRTRA